MSFFNASTKAEDVKQGGSNYINRSGIYPVRILASFASASKGGSTSVDLYLDHAGQKQVLYGNLRITNNDGSPNKIGSKIFNQLVIIAGLEGVSDPIDGQLPIGKNDAMKDVAVLEDLSDIDALIRVQMEYSLYNGKIQEKKVIKSFFRAADRATAEEIVNETEPGAGYEAELKYADNITFRDDLDEAAIEAWIKGGRKEEGGAPSAPKKAPAFGARRFGSNSNDE